MVSGRRRTDGLKREREAALRREPRPPPRLYAASAPPRRHWPDRAGKAEDALRPASQETGHATETDNAVGCDGKENDMTKSTQTAATRSGAALVQPLIVALIGAGVIFLSGFAQSETLHAAAHDVRHATGFPCH